MDGCETGEERRAYKSVMILYCAIVASVVPCNEIPKARRATQAAEALGV